MTSVEKSSLSTQRLKFSLSQMINSLFDMVKRPLSDIFEASVALTFELVLKRLPSPLTSIKKKNFFLISERPKWPKEGTAKPFILHLFM